MTQITRVALGTVAVAATAVSAGLTLPEPAFGQTVADRTLSDVRSERTGACATLTVNFNIRVQVLSTFPNNGRELHVRLRPLDNAAANKLRESLRTPQSIPELRSIEYEGDNAAGPTLSLFFTQDMEFSVSPGTQPQTLIIKIAPPGGMACAVDAATPPPTQTAPAAAASEGDATATAGLIGEAEQAIQEKSLDRAVQLLTNAVQKPENANTPRALELLGLTRERKGQTAHARAEYDEYLRRYPSAEGADRVRQRMAALDGPASGGQPGTPLREAGKLGGNGKWKWGLRGSFSQFYFRDQGRTSTLIASSTLGTEVDNSVNVNQLLSSGDITISAGDDRRNFQLRAAGSYTKNFGTSTSITTINNGNEMLTYRSRPGGGIGALTALYFDYTDKDLNSQLRIGRQSRNSSGVLGRFDGALLGWQANPKLRLNAVGGFPVLSSRQTHVLTERPFYGVSVDLGAKRSPVQTTLYWFDQRAKGGFVDRRSVGIETRFLRPRFNAYAMVDYDVKFGELNLALGSLTYNFADGSNFSLTGDYRRSPLLTTTNALIGQFDLANSAPITQLTGLRPFFTDDQIYQMARDRTLIAKTLTVTYARPITKKLQVNADFSLSDTGGTAGTPASVGTPEIFPLPATGKEYYYGLQLIGSDMVMANDIYILSGRIADTANAKIYTADFNARIPVTSNFRLSPRVRYGYRDGKVTSNVAVPGNYSQFQPTLRLNYYPLKRSEIEIEFGGNFTRQMMWNGSAFDRIKETGWVLNAGYRLDF